MIEIDDDDDGDDEGDDEGDDDDDDDDGHGVCVNFDNDDDWETVVQVYSRTK